MPRGISKERCRARLIAEANDPNPSFDRVTHWDRRKTERRMYQSKAWRQLRKEQLAKEPVCASCGDLATQVDHIQKFLGDWNLFTSRENLQSLCGACHRQKTRAKE